MRRILAHPADPLPRLVFADWLDDTGASSNMAWARYLRLAEEIATTDDARLTKLSRELERASGRVRARLTYPAQVFVSDPEAMLRVLPAGHMSLNVDHVLVPQATLDIVPLMVARERLVLPLAQVGPRLAVAIAQPNVRWFTDPLRFILNRELLTFPVPVDSARKAVERNYGPFESETLDSGPRMPVVYGDLLADNADEDVPVVPLVNLLLAEVLNSGATSLQLEPTPTIVRVWRHHAHNTQPIPRDPLPRRLLIPIVTRLRVMAGLPAWSTDPVQVGWLLFAVRARSFRLSLAIEIGPHGPGVTLSPSPPELPIALNPAA